MNTITIPLHSEMATLALAGGKGANLARLARAGLPVPGGFMLTTNAYRAYVDANELTPAISAALSKIQPDDPPALQTASETIRAAFAAGETPPELATAVADAYHALGRNIPVAVRSSATAEDLPDMSFAGQQDTFLNIVGEAALLEAVVACWSSLWTARAIGYRARNEIAQSDVALAIVVQEMVPSQASGVLFTANPLNGRRAEMVVDATLGLGEALVSGQVEPDHYVVEAATGRVLSRTLGQKALAIIGRPGGGVETVARDGANRAAVPDAVIAELAALGRAAEALFGGPQDVEWGWADGRLHLLQSRPITSLFPAPDAGPELRVFFSFASVQGLMGPMTPLGRDAIRAIFAGMARMVGLERTAATQTVVYEAGGRLWIDFTPLIRHPLGRRLLTRVLPLIDPAAAVAISSLRADPRLAPTPGWFKPATFRRVLRMVLPMAIRFIGAARRPDAARRSAQRLTEAMTAVNARRWTGATTLAGQVALLEEMLAAAFPTLLPTFIPAMGPGMAALNVLAWLGRDLPPDAPDPLLLTRGLPHNVTTEMDLALWRTAQAIRADQEATAAFGEHDAAALAEAYLDGRLPPAAQTAVARFLAGYGMRGLGEIDIGRPRWREDPTPVMQVLGSYLHIDDPHQAPDAVFARGAAAAEAVIGALETAVRRTRLGLLKARLIAPAARRVRALAGLRESPKFTIIRMFGVARAGLLESGRRLVDEGAFDRPDDLFFLRLDELRELAAGVERDWRGRVAERRTAVAREKRRRQIPRLLLSDGEAFYEGMGAADAGDGSLSGSPVSPGVVEGAVHVVLDPQGAQLQPGEILVCPGTDPAWTPLFLAAGGLVMEVGGLMTHGSVVAREYGIPAVVGVHEATTRLQTGQRVRVDGTAGRVTIIVDGEL